MFTKRKCLICDYEGTTELPERVDVCPECGGAYIDIFYWSAHKARLNKRKEVAQYKLSDLGVALFDNHGELRKVADILKDVENSYHEMCQTKPESPLLTIEIQDETSVPKVFYEGKEITGKVRVSFDWETKTAELGSGGTQFNIEHNELIDKEPVHKGIGLARGKYGYARLD